MSRAALHENTSSYSFARDKTYNIALPGAAHETPNLTNQTHLTNHPQ